MPWLARRCLNTGSVYRDPAHETYNSLLLTLAWSGTKHDDGLLRARNVVSEK